MGDINTVLITGAGGSLGQYTVAAARSHGLNVRAMVRRENAIPATWQEDAGIETIVLDLAEPGDALVSALAGIDVVLHLAASLHGDDTTHSRDTILATQNLYDALYDALCDRPIPVVLAGSVSVYQGIAGLIDEDSPIEPSPDRRDAYMRAKFDQETIALTAAKTGVSTHILRLGAIYHPDHVWNAHLGVTLGPVLIKLAGAGEIPLCFAPHAALALVRAAQHPLAIGTCEALNIVDDNLPDASTYLAMLDADKRPRFTLTFPWQILMPIARFLRVLRLPVPGLLRPETLTARMAPRRFSNARAKVTLGWQPATKLATSLRSGAKT